MDDKREIIKAQIEINWDYAKQQNDIHSRIFLQFTIVLFTLGMSCIIASTTIDNTMYVAALLLSGIAFLLCSAFYTLRLRDLTYDLEEDWKRNIYWLEKLKENNEGDS